MDTPRERNVPLPSRTLNDERWVEDHAKVGGTPAT
jgi:hypothetical protein